MDVINKIIITPYVSVNDFQLGASKKEVEKKFGKAYSVVENNIMKIATELREAKELVYLKKGRDYILDSVRCLKDTNPFIAGVNIFEIGLDGLKLMDNSFIEGDRYTTFRNLGISVGGFGKKKVAEKRIVIAFRRESLDSFETFAEV